MDHINLKTNMVLGVLTESLMKNNRLSTRRERNYALRRVIYDTLLAAKAVQMVATVRRDYSGKETPKVTGLLMARNLDEFFFKQGRFIQDGKSPNDAYRYDDDVFVSDLGISGWSPAQSARLSKTDSKRISQLVGHLVAKAPKPFADDNAVNVITPLLKVSVDCVTYCLRQKRASLTGQAPYYLRRLNGILKDLGLSRISIPST